jgi:hypothetical protein
MAWKSSVELSREEVITRLYNIIWEESSDAELEDALNAAMGPDYGTKYWIVKANENEQVITP